MGQSGCLSAFVLVGLTEAQTDRPAAGLRGNRPHAEKDRAAASAEPLKLSLTSKDEQHDSAPITVSGRELDAEDKPISGTEIFLASPRNDDQPLATTTTDEEGRSIASKRFRCSRAATPRSQGVATFEVFGRAEEEIGFSLAAAQMFLSVYGRAGRQMVDGPNGTDRTRFGPIQFGREDAIELDLNFGPSGQCAGRIVDDSGAFRRCTAGDPRDVQPVGRRAMLGTFCILQRNLAGARGRKNLVGRIRMVGSNSWACPADYNFWIDPRPAGHSPHRI